MTHDAQLNTPDVSHIETISFGAALTRKRHKGHNVDMTTEVAGHVPAVTLGLRMYMALRDSKISHQEMADYLGVARTSITRWTHDSVQPGRATLVAWATQDRRAFGVARNGRHRRPEGRR